MLTPTDSTPVGVAGVSDYQALFDGAPLPMLVCDFPAFTVVAANAAAAGCYGCTPAELLGRTFADATQAEDAAVLIASLLPTPSGAVFSRRSLHRRRDGTPFEAVVAASHALFGGRAAVQLSITRTSEEPVGSDQPPSARTASAVLDSLPVAVAVFQAGRHVFVNTALATLTGYSREVLLGLHPRALSRPEDHALVERRIIDGLGGKVLSPRAAKILRVDGKLVDSEISGRRIDLEGRPALLVFFTDVTERQEMLSRLALSDRMVPVGTLAAGVAHEINNPLAFVMMNLTFVTEEIERVVSRRAEDVTLRSELAEVNEALSDARVGADRVRQIVRDLKVFARVDDQAAGPVDVCGVMETCVTMSQSEIQYRARLVKEFEAVEPLYVNEARLAQLFLNLLVNATQAIPEGDAARNEIRVSIARLADEGIRITVADTGAGISPENLPRIFDPFFTTRPVGVGAGMGLSISHTIVTTLGGTIRAESTPGRGSKFIVELPRSARGASDFGQSRGGRRPERQCRLLIIDDEDSIGLAMKRALQPTVEVEFVTSGAAALDIIRSGMAFDVVLCDLMMPGMSGIDFHRELEALNAGLARRIIFMTGGAYTAAADAFFRQTARWTLEKPFEVDQLLATIAEVVEVERPIE